MCPQDPVAGRSPGGRSGRRHANDEYALEAALKLVEAAGEGDVTLLAMAPAAAPETLRKALAMGASGAS